MAVAAIQQPAQSSGVLRALGLMLVCTLLAGMQLLIGTDPAYTLLVVTFVLLWATTIAVLGGVATVTGFSVTLLGLQHVVISQIAKALYGQRPDLPLLEPISTMLMYNIGMAGLLAAALLLRASPARHIKSMVQPELRLDRLKIIAIGVTVLMLMRYLGVTQFGRLFGILNQFEFISPLAVAASTAYIVLKSEKKQCFGLLNMVTLAVPLMMGIIFSVRREAVFAILIFIITAIAFGYRFKFYHYVLGACVALFFQFIVFPYSLATRSELRSGTLTQNAGQAYELFVDVLENPGDYQDVNKEAPPPQNYEMNRMFYYGEPIPTLDRLSVMISSDALVRSTETDGTTGWYTIVRGFEMVVPRVFQPDKDPIGTSNWIANRAPGLVHDTDFVTSITLGPFIDAFVSFKWWGVAIISFVLGLCFFGIYKLVIVDRLAMNIWACALTIYVPWIFSEGTLQENTVSIFQNAPLYGAFALFAVIAANSLCKKDLNDYNRPYAPLKARGLA